jgi:MFS family permease
MMTTLRRNVPLVILCGGLLVTVSMGIRHGFGLFLPPITEHLGIGRETFAFALAGQQLMWGLFQPFTGAIADRWGSGRTLVGGTAIYALGLVVMSEASTVFDLNLVAGLLIGFGLSATSFAVVLGAVGRVVAPEKRGIAFGIVSAGGSFGQFAMAPIAQGLIGIQGWSQALVSLALMAAVMAPLALLLAGRAADMPGHSRGDVRQTLRQAVAEASVHRGFIYLTAGFFVCGWQVGFIMVHLPAYILDVNLPASVAAWALGLIGFFNIIGTYGCGWLGDRYSRKYLLSLLYLVRAIVVAIFLVAAKTEASVLMFSAAIGLLWLGTVPLTSSLVAQIFGVQYLTTLFGIVFLSHQVGSFLGIWLGGWMFDATGSYTLFWIGSIAFGVGAAIIHMPITDAPVPRLQRQAA